MYKITFSAAKVVKIIDICKFFCIFFANCRCFAWLFGEISFSNLKKIRLASCRSIKKETGHGVRAPSLGELAYRL